MLGMISAVVAVVPLGLVRAWLLQTWLNAFNLHPRRDRHVKLWVTQSFIQALCPLKNKSLVTLRVLLGNIPLSRMMVSIDAFLIGWGAVWKGRMVRGVWSFPWQSCKLSIWV